MEEWIRVKVVGVEGGRWDSDGVRRTGGGGRRRWGFFCGLGVVWAEKKGGGGDGVSFVGWGGI